MNWRAWPTGALLTADGALLVSGRHIVATTARHVTAPHAWLARVGTDAALASLSATALWLVGAWLAVGLLAALVAGLPGALGRAGALVTRTVLPQAVLRLLAGSAGLGVLLAPVAAAAQPASHGTSGAALACASPTGVSEARAVNGSNATDTDAVGAIRASGAPHEARPATVAAQVPNLPAEVASTGRSAATLPAPVWPAAAPSLRRTSGLPGSSRPSSAEPSPTATDPTVSAPAALPTPTWPTSEPRERRSITASQPSTRPPSASSTPPAHRLPTTLPTPVWPTSEPRERRSITASRPSTESRSPGSTAPAPGRPTILPAPTWPSTAQAPTGSPSEPLAASGTPADIQQPPDGRRSVRPAERPAAVRVHAGDSLWLIAARRLGPRTTPAQVAAAWPRWYAANREVIGDDPALIVPGQVLHAPDQPSGASR